MAIVVVMPRLSDTMEEGKVLRWLKAEGDRVEGGEIIAEIQTDKADIEMEAFGSGVLRKIVIGAGESARVGHLIGVIAEEDEDISALLLPAAGPGAAAARPAAPAAAAPAAIATVAPAASHRVKASPLAKRLAKDAGIDLAAVRGSGPGGRVIRRDLAPLIPAAVAAGRAVPSISPVTPMAEPAVTAAAPAPAPGFEDRALSPMRRAIAKRVAQSASTVPHFYLTVEVEMEKAAELREAMQAQTPDLKVTFTDLIVKATSLALVRHPAVNASFIGEAIRVYAQVNIGIAVALEGGLINPVLRECDRKSLAQIAKEAKSLIERARAQKLRVEEYSGATFTVSNLGMYDIEEFTAIINPPEAAILAIGSIQSKPVVVDGQVRIGHRMRMTLSCDHRAVDGATGAKFLQEVKQLLEQPFQLVL